MQPTGLLVDFGVIRLFLLLGLQEVKARCMELFALDQPLDPSQIIQLEASALTSSSSFVSEVRKNICKKGGGEDIVGELELGKLQMGAKDIPLGSKILNSVNIFSLFGAVISVLLAVSFALFLMRLWRSGANFFPLIKITHYPKHKCSNNFVFVCKKFYVSSVFFELNSPVGIYMISNLAQYEILNSHFSLITLIIWVVKGVALIFHFFVWFGSFIKIWLNLDLFVQPALLLLLKFLSGWVLSTKLFFL